MSYYATPESFYRFPEVETPFWQLAPVPGWGINPNASSPVSRVGVGGIGCRCDANSLRGFGAAGDEYNETSWGMVALGTTGGIFLGMLFSWAWYSSRKKA